MEIENFLNPEILSTLQTGGYVLMFGLMVAEGPLITIAAAFLASFWLFDIYLVALLGWLGDMTGDFLFFALGRYGIGFFRKKREWARKKVDESFIQKVDSLLQKNILLALIIIKLTPYAPPIGLTYIGQTPIAFYRYLRASFISCIPIPLFAAIAGFHIGYIKSLLQASSLENIIIYGISGTLLLGGIIVWTIFFLRKHTKLLTEDFSLEEKTEKSTTSDE